MPLYEYRCPRCDYTVELLQRIQDGIDSIECPLCWVDNVLQYMVRRISRTGFVLRGSCWSADGYTYNKDRK